MLLIGESGSTKTHWKIIDKNKVVNAQTKGINPFFVSEKEIINILMTSSFFDDKTEISDIYFYGAGLSNEKQKSILKQLFASLFKNTMSISVYDDLLAAAHALFKHSEGIACILGTGSNSGLYNGKEISNKIPALGYILGDEGSGAVLGKTFLNAFFKQEFSNNLQKKLTLTLQLNMNDILDNVYKKPLANRYLAKYVKIILTYLDEPEIVDLVKKCFREFVEKNILKYVHYKTQNIGFVGSVAFYFREFLNEVLLEYGIKNAKIIQHPIDELESFYTTPK